MYEFLNSLEDKNDLIWTELLNCFYDFFNEFEDLEYQSVKAISRMIEIHGYKKIYSLIVKHDQQDPVDPEFMYCLARTGAIEIVPVVESWLNSSDNDDVVLASICLALVKDPRGLVIIEQLCKGEYKIKLDQTPKWHFDERIDHIDDPRAREIERKYF